MLRALRLEGYCCKIGSLPWLVVQVRRFRPPNKLTQEPPACVAAFRLISPLNSDFRFLVVFLTLLSK